MAVFGSMDYTSDVWKTMIHLRIPMFHVKHGNANQRDFRVAYFELSTLFHVKHWWFDEDINSRP